MEAESRLRAAAVGREIDEATQLRVPVLIVEGVDPVGRDLRKIDGIAGRAPPGPAQETSLEVGRSIRPGAHAGGRLGPAAASGEDLHDTGDRVRAVQHARRSPNNLDPVHVFSRQIREIESPAGIVDRNPIDQHADEVVVPAAEVQGREPPKRTSLHHGGAGHFPQGIQDVFHALATQRVAM